MRLRPFQFVAREHLIDHVREVQVFKFDWFH
jgi:hypothetical protein